MYSHLKNETQPTPTVTPDYSTTASYSPFGPSIEMLASPAIETTPAEVDERTTALWRELVDNSVECELCNEPYDDDDAGHIPRLLICGHTYCQVETPGRVDVTQFARF